MIVVTGAAGFIGSNLVRGLNRRGIEDIIAVDDLTEGDKFVNLVDCKIADYMDKDDFRRRVEQSPQVAWALLLELSRRLRRADEKIGSLVLLDVPGRIARVILDAADEAGKEIIEKPLTHQTIAHVIGASRETVSRAMREFVESGWISTEGRRIRITDRAALEKRSQQRL